MIRPSTVRRVVAALVVVSMVSIAAAVLLAGTGEPDVPTWEGPPLATGRGTATTIDVAPLSVASPERIAARLLGRAEPSFTTTTERDATVYTDGDVTVRVRAVSPVILVGQRAAAAGTLPADEAAVTAATGVLTAFGLDPQRWTPKVTSAQAMRSVQFAPKADLPIFSTSGVTTPFVTVGVDANGVRSFLVVLATLTPRQVAIGSQQEAFDDLPRAGRYEKVRLVLVDTGRGQISPYWEFEDEDGELAPVSAVLTP